MYAGMAFISVLIRQLFLPNPFECFGEKAFVYNWIASLLLAFASFRLVGLIYTKGSAPALGSFLYLAVYAALTGLLWLLGQAAFAWWAVGGMIAAAVAVVVLIKKINDRQRW